MKLGLGGRREDWKLDCQKMGCCQPNICECVCVGMFACLSQFGCALQPCTSCLRLWCSLLQICEVCNHGPVSIWIYTYSIYTDVDCSVCIAAVHLAVVILFLALHLWRHECCNLLHRSASVRSGRQPVKSTGHIRM